MAQRKHDVELVKQLAPRYCGEKLFDRMFYSDKKLRQVFELVYNYSHYIIAKRLKNPLIQVNQTILNYNMNNNKLTSIISFDIEEFNVKYSSVLDGVDDKVILTKQKRPQIEALLKYWLKFNPEIKSKDNLVVTDKDDYQREITFTDEQIDCITYSGKKRIYWK